MYFLLLNSLQIFLLKINSNGFFIPFCIIFQLKQHCYVARKIDCLNIDHIFFCYIVTVTITYCPIELRQTQSFYYFQTLNFPTFANCEIVLRYEIQFIKILKTFFKAPKYSFQALNHNVISDTLIFLPCHL